VRQRAGEGRHGVLLWLIPVLILAGCSAAQPGNVKSAPPSAPTTSTTLTGQAAIRQWESTNLSALTNLVTNVDTFSITAGDCSSEPTSACEALIGTACSGLEGTARSAQSIAAIPDAAAEQVWSIAVSDYVQGAQECTDSSSTGNFSMISQAVQQLTAAKAQLLNLERLGGSRLSVRQPT
jgi:hypothetical protein